MMNDVIETGKKFAEETKAKLETVYADLNEKAKVSVEKSTKAIEEFSDIAKGNVEALVESGKIAAKGFETLGQEAVDYSRKSFEKATVSFKSFSTVKTPTEFFTLQSQLLSSSFDEFTKEDRKSRSEEHTSELQSLMRISYAVFCLKKTKHKQHENNNSRISHNTKMYN